MAKFIYYEEIANTLIEENKKNSLLASTEDVKKAFKSKDTLVVDIRTKEEWAGAYIKGSVRIGRDDPENIIANFVLDDDNRFIKDKLIIVCNSAKKASIQAIIFRKMGFSEVKVYGIFRWIDECNPVATKYSDKRCQGLEFGDYYAKHCKKVE